jgi:hypothetical protein
MIVTRQHYERDELLAACKDMVAKRYAGISAMSIAAARAHSVIAKCEPLTTQEK